MSGPEARIQRAIQNELTAEGHFCFKVHGSALMMAGLPDLICCVGGVFVGLEVKTPSTHTNLSARQIYVAELIADSGGMIATVCSVEEAMQVVAAVRAIVEICDLSSIVKAAKGSLRRA